MTFYAALTPETHALLEAYEHAAAVYDWSRTEEHRMALEIARDEALEAAAADFRRIGMESDEAAAGVGL